jgi:hypothetical protein
LPKTPRRNTAETPSLSVDEELCLIGPNSLVDFIRFVKRRAVGGRDMKEGDIADTWRGAARVFQALQASEAGAAEGPQILPLPAPIKAHVRKLMRQPHFQRAFRSVPVAFGMVEIDKLVACQFELTVSTVKGLKKSFAPDLSPASIAGICMPLAPPDARFSVAREAPGEFVFQADTHDFRYLGAQMLSSDQLPGLSVNGFPAGVVALSVGFSTNVLNVVRYGQRMVLNNGYHRVHALRALGVTHAPCIIQVCELWDDVGLAGMAEIHDNGTLYFNSARPPLVKDYFNPELTVRYPTRRMKKQIQLKIESESMQICD